MEKYLRASFPVSGNLYTHTGLHCSSRCWVHYSHCCFFTCHGKRHYNARLGSRPTDQSPFSSSPCSAHSLTNQFTADTEARTVRKKCSKTNVFPFPPSHLLLAGGVRRGPCPWRRGSVHAFSYSLIHPPRLPSARECHGREGRQVRPAARHVPRRLRVRAGVAPRARHARHHPAARPRRRRRQDGVP
jgi:hypothetical protein